MKIAVSMPKKAYLSAMRQKMGAITDFGQERLTGIIVGNFFSVTHHAGWEFNRRFTNEKNRAVGFVTGAGEETGVRFLHFRGGTDPASLIGFFLLWYLVAGIGWGDFSEPGLVWMGLVITAIYAAYTAIATFMTERGQEGTITLHGFLRDPKNTWV